MPRCERLPHPTSAAFNMCASLPPGAPADAVLDDAADLVHEVDRIRLVTGPEVEDAALADRPGDPVPRDLPAVVIQADEHDRLRRRHVVWLSVPLLRGNGEVF